VHVEQVGAWQGVPEVGQQVGQVAPCNGVGHIRPEEGAQLRTGERAQLDRRAIQQRVGLTARDWQERTSPPDRGCAKQRQLEGCYRRLLIAHKTLCSTRVRAGVTPTRFDAW
jgi:hypothetical protein